MNVLPTFKLTFEWMMTNVAKFIQYCRYVSNFNGVDSYAQFDNAIVLLGDFLISVDLNLVNNEGIHVILGNSDTTTFIATTGSDGEIRVRIRNEEHYFDIGTTTGTNKTLTLERVGFDVTAGFNDVYETVTFAGNGSFVFDLLAKNNAGFYLESTIFNLTTTGSTVIDLPMDETSETTTVNYINRAGNTDYNATGYNITTTQECVTIPANTVFVDGVPVTDEDGEYVTA